MKTIKVVLAVIVLFVLPFTVFASRSVTLPWTMNYDDDGWVSDLARTECGGTSTHVTGGCYSGGCMKVTPPTSPCTGGGINGGANGMDWVNYPNTSRIHVRFLIKFGSSFAQNVIAGSGGPYIKFILQDSPSRTGILYLICSDSAGRYCSFGVYSSGGVTYFRSPPNRGWIEDARFRISSTSHINEWIAIEYYIDTAANDQGIYIWTQDAMFNGKEIENRQAYGSGGQSGLWLSYYNSYSRTDANNYYLIDNVVISNTYIGPPEGFLNSAPSAPSDLRVVE